MFPWGFDKVYWPVHHLNVMEPPCSSTYHILDDVYLLEQSTNMRFLNNRIPPLVVTENHSGIQCKFKQLTEELSQPDCLTRGHASSNIFCFSSAQNHRLLLLAHPGYRSRSQGETTPERFLASIQWGSTKYELTMLTAKHMFGWKFTKNINANEFMKLRGISQI